MSNFESGWNCAKTDATLGLDRQHAPETDWGRGYSAGWADAHRDRTPAVAGCAMCKRVAEAGFGPSHGGAACCRMGVSIASGGDVAHCTCNGCF